MMIDSGRTDNSSGNRVVLSGGRESSRSSSRSTSSSWLHPSIIFGSPRRRYEGGGGFGSADLLAQQQQGASSSAAYNNSSSSSSSWSSSIRSSSKVHGSKIRRSLMTVSKSPTKFGLVVALFWCSWFIWRRFIWMRFMTSGSSFWFPLEVPDPNYEFHIEEAEKRGYDLFWNQMQDYETAEEWYPLGNTGKPYTEMAPQLDVVWARGWYNSYAPPPSVPIEYYNKEGQDGRLESYMVLREYFPPTLCGPRWIRITDIKIWITFLRTLKLQRCPFTLITGDGILSIPDDIPEEAKQILDHPLLETWYAQNVVSPPGKKHPKLQPIPVGLPIHYGFDKSPNSAYTIETMDNIRTDQWTPFRKRSRKVLFDHGTIEGREDPASKLRKAARLEALDILKECPKRVEIMDYPTPTVETWEKHYSQHQFAVVVRGTGWDTYRTWEYLFFGTIPILLESNPLVHNLHFPAHVPIVVVKNWTEICEWTEMYYEAMVGRYEHWIENAHNWVRPSLWVPRNQTEMERLCDISEGCRLQQYHPLVFTDYYRNHKDRESKFGGH